MTDHTCRFGRALLLAMIGCWAGSVQADVFTAVVDNERLTLSCEGSAVVDTPCRFGIGTAGDTQVRFTTQSTRYAHLLKRGIEKVLDDKQHKLRPIESDIPLLRGLALDKCHPAAESQGVSGDLLQLCVPAGSASVVLFMRGLCDRCGFEPIVLKKQRQ
jgi:hypothetical protein